MSRTSASTVAYRRCGSLCIAVRHSTSRSAHCRGLLARRRAADRQTPAARAPPTDGRSGSCPRTIASDLARRLAGEIERQAAGEQLVQHHAERIDVGVNAEPPGADLLRRRVGRRHQPHARCASDRSAPRGSRAASRCRSRAASRVPSVGDENVRRLEIAMDDRVPMRVLHRLAHVAEQRSRSAIVDACVSQYVVSGMPSTYSMTNHGVPSGSVSAS